MVLTLVFTLAMVGFGRLLFGRWMGDLCDAIKFGLSGILAFGTVGLATLFIGLLPSGLNWGIAVVAIVGAAGTYNIFRLRIWEEKIFPRKPKGFEWLFVAVIGFATLVAVIAVLAPSTSLDWDTIAYHLAVPKLWLAAGNIYPIPYIHHSNFPLSVDNLYIWGLYWGGQSGAKAFQLCFYLLGTITVFGFAQMRYGNKAAAWAALTFATVPVVLWEAGTAYIDVAHGLYAAAGVMLIAQMMERGKQAWVLAALCLGFAVGSKYTGLQVLIAVALVYGIYSLLKARQTSKALTFTLLLGLAIGAPWYVKNEIWMENPVYPFFYEQFGGKNWSQYNADIYRDQQQIFGVPRRGPAAGIAAFPDAVLGLAFQPGRYTDPAPKLVYSDKGVPSGALGFGWQSTGAAIIAAGLLWMLSGKIRRFEGLLLGWIGVSFLMWFALSQQSRYAITFAPVLAVLLGGGIARLRAGPALGAVAVAQACGTLAVLFFYPSLYPSQIQVVTGKVTTGDYLGNTVPFDAFQWLNQHARGGRVALYDEVFGFYLDVPYFWANPGHTTLIGYDRLNDGAQYIARMKQMGFTYLYMSTSYGSYTPEEGAALRAIAGVGGPVLPLNDQTATALEGRAVHPEDIKNDPGQKYKWLIADAASRGLLGNPLRFKGGFILQIR